MGIETEVQSLLQRVRSHGQLRVVVHAAGVCASGLLSEQDQESMRRVWSPKADGAWWLHKVCTNIRTCGHTNVRTYTLYQLSLPTPTSHLLLLPILPISTRLATKGFTCSFSCTRLFRPCLVIALRPTTVPPTPTVMASPAGATPRYVSLNFNRHVENYRRI